MSPLSEVGRLVSPRPYRGLPLRFENVLLFSLGSVVCLTPFVIYLFRICSLVRRHHPVILSGVWDFAGLLAGLSGFLLFGGALFLSIFHSDVRFAARGNFKMLQDSWEHERIGWVLTVFVYLLLVVAAMAWGFWQRRRSLVMYNVEPVVLEHTIEELFEQLGRKVERHGNSWFSGDPLFRIDSSDASQTATLRWLSEDLLLFQEVERHLRHTLPSLSSGENPTTKWLMSVAVLGLVVLLFNSAMLGYLLR